MGFGGDREQPHLSKGGGSGGPPGRREGGQLCAPLSTVERAGSAVGGDCSCNTAVCQIFQQGYFYLYPFNIEYSLFASTMLYVMWKNVGRLLASSTHGHSHTPSPVSLFRETFFAGPVLGLMLFVVGLAVLIIYEVQVSEERGRAQQALVIYYSFTIVCLGLMTLVSLSGSVIYRFDRRAMDHHKNPTRTLDVALLMGAALGQYAISYYSIVAVVVGTPRDLLAALNLAHALLMIAQQTFQNVFIIESLHRGPPGAEPHPTPPKEPCHGLTFTNLDALHALPACPPTPRLVGPNPAGPQEAVGSIVAPRSPWKRRCLKDIALFLLPCNVIVSNWAEAGWAAGERQPRKDAVSGSSTRAPLSCSSLLDPAYSRIGVWLSRKGAGSERVRGSPPGKQHFRAHGQNEIPAFRHLGNGWRGPRERCRCCGGWEEVRGSRGGGLTPRWEV